MDFFDIQAEDVMMAFLHACTLVDSNMEIKKIGIVDKHSSVKAPIVKKSNKKYDLLDCFKRKLSVVSGAMNF